MTLLLSIAALLSAFVTTGAKTRDAKSLQYVFKPLTMLLIISLAVLNFSAPPSFYQKMIVAGLILSTVGDVFLIEHERFFVHGLISFLFGHFCYIAAFWTAAPNTPSGVFYLLYVAFFLAVLWKSLGKLKVPVIVYAVALALMSWLALSRYFEAGDDKTLYAFLGSISFLVSDSLLAYNKFKTPLALAPLLILGTYFLAQWLIALSV